MEHHRSEPRHPRRCSVTVDLSTQIGSVELPNPVMTASGTAGYGPELARSFDLSTIGAVVTKSLAHFAWDGNPALRVHQTTGGMINSVGLQGPGVTAWLTDHLPALLDTGARVVASIWGRSVDDYRLAAEQLAAADERVVAIEVNLSCPNTETGRDLYAHDPEATAAVMAVTEACGRPRWAKLSPNTSELVGVAGAARDAGAEAVTLVNTVLGMAIDVENSTYRLGSGARGGGLSGPAIHPIAVRAVHDVHAAHPELPIVGVGGIASGLDAAEFVLAGASAIQVGTATFVDPAASSKVSAGLESWLLRCGSDRLTHHIGAVHEH